MMITEIMMTMMTMTVMMSMDSMMVLTIKMIVEEMRKNLVSDPVPSVPGVLKIEDKLE